MKVNQFIKEINEKTKRANADNISRTIMYERFYKNNPEIKWSLLAGLVSRNAGWNMTDLKSKWFQQMLTDNYCELLFQTYERANWTIFADAYPQLLWYEWAKKQNSPHLFLLETLGVSRFMQEEWRHFWHGGDQERLCTALIINEQYMIEETVMNHPLYSKKVFSSLLYILEEHAHMSYVIFPTISGELYGLYVRNFKKVDSRIWLGKQLQQLLFHPDIHHDIYLFILRTPPTGSRLDYQQYLNWSTGNTSPVLRKVYPLVSHHWKEKKDWSKTVWNTERYFKKIKTVRPKERTDWLQKKWVELFLVQKMSKLVGK
ncbi:DUF2515 domain-containing protein [Alkalihalobacillus sp. MEB130]|uniref:DUF2515 family protein n=1 Tax=Alkalihalobacillus sp. MEB130 TaxID=2976704 RepID=UPI0028DD5B25|nr:DUF2515 family protein [Alkalihalobacillus sp. MEB130]MDT8859965.1 DUF2515 domain-containing protein [Alkalihalobacillus sp. MEB130]